VAATKANHKDAEAAEKNNLDADFHGCTRIGWHGLLPPPTGTPAALRRAEVFAQRSQTSALDRSNFPLSPVPRLPASVGQKPRRKSVPSPSPFLHTREVSWNSCNPWQAFKKSCQKTRTHNPAIQRHRETAGRNQRFSICKGGISSETAKPNTREKK
jgi:hypothetical protein